MATNPFQPQGSFVGHGRTYILQAQRCPRTQFSVSSLPAELQDMIWEASIPNALPQTFIIKHKTQEHMTLRSGREVLVRRLIAVREESEAPGELLVSVSSRRVYKKYYPLCFARQLHSEPIRFETSVDTLCFPNIGLLGNATRVCSAAAFKADVLIPLQHLEIRNFMEGNQLVYVAQNFQNLKTLTLTDFGDQNREVLRILTDAWLAVGMPIENYPTVYFED